MAIQVPLPGEAGPSTGPYTLSHTLTGHTRSITALRFTPDGRKLLSAGADGYVLCWDAVTCEHLRSVRCHRTGINDLSVSPDSLYFATASDDGTALVFPLVPTPGEPPDTIRRSPPLRALKGHTAPVLSVAFNPKSNLLATGSFDESVIIWDVRGGREIRTIPAHSEAVWSVGWDAEGGMVVTSSADGLIRLWDVNTGQCLKTFDNDTNSPVSFSCFTPSPFFLLSVTLSSTVRIYNIHTAKVLKTFRAAQYTNEKHPCPAAVIPAPTSTQVVNGEDAHGAGSRVGKQALVVAGSEDGSVVIWELGTKSVLQVLGGHQRPVVAVAVSPDGKTIVSGSLEPEKMINVWRA